MKSLLAGEKILETFSADSKFGKCTICVTNFGLSLENNAFGLFLSLEHNEILSCLPINKNSARMSWVENQTVFEFVIRCEKPETFCRKYRQIKDDYIHLKTQLGLGCEIITERFTIQNPLVEKKRFEKIPDTIPNCDTWNDCWFVRAKNIYVTHNHFFKSWKDLQTRPHQIEYRIESKDDGIVILGDRAVFKFGFPAIKLPASKGVGWFLLPTIDDQMCTWEIEAARFAKDPDSRIDFVTR